MECEPVYPQHGNGLSKFGSGMLNRYSNLKVTALLLKGNQKMTKTALDLTPEEIYSYQPAKKSDKGHGIERYEQAWALAHTAAQLLRERFGVTKVVAFGSLIHPESFNIWSDVDLAAWGIPDDQFYQAVAAVTGISQDFQVDLVDAENCRPTLRRSIEREGINL